MAHIPYLHELVILFGSALAVIAFSQFLKIPPTVGFLLTGVVIGPHGLGLIQDSAHIEVLAELGVVFLLFVIGLEVSIEQLKKMKNYLMVGGGLQALITTILVVLAGTFLGYPLATSFFLGSLVVMSSTALVLKAYSDRKEVSSPQGKLSIGILLFQDLLIVPFLLLVPIIAGKFSGTVSKIIWHFGGGLLIVGIVFILGKYLIPYFLHFVVSTGIRELFIIGGLFACLGMAWLTESIGFSLAFGAFLSGILLSESDYRHQMLAEMGSIRDVFTSMFFISIGMLLSLNFALHHIVQIILLVTVVVILKFAVLYVSAKSLSFPFRTCFITALGLSQVGEFAFVLIRSGYTHGLIDENLYQLAIASSVTTMLLTPLFIGLAPLLADWFGNDGKAVPRGSGKEELGKKDLSGHVIIVGLGLNGRHLARVLKSAHCRFICIDLDPTKVNNAKNNEDPAHFGDATQRDILEYCGIQKAAIIVYAISDPVALRRSVRLARQLNQEVYIVVRTWRLSEIEELQSLGANEVVAQEFEASIEIVTILLTRLHLPRNIIRAQSKLLRADGYQMLRAPATTTGISEQVALALASGTTDTFLLSGEHRAVGQSIQNLDLRKKTGASIIAVVRKEKSIPNPSADLVLEQADVLVLVGSHEEIESAFIFLEDPG